MSTHTEDSIDTKNLIPTQASAPLAQKPTDNFFDPTLRHWHKGTGRAISSVADLLEGTTDGAPIRLSLPSQLLSVVEVRLRSAAEYSIRGAEHHPHVEDAIKAAAHHVKADLAEVHVTSLRGDTHRFAGAERQYAEALAAVRAVFKALEVNVSDTAISRLVASTAGTTTSLALPGLAPVDATGTPLRAWEWYPQYAVVWLHEKGSKETTFSHGNVTGLLAEFDIAVKNQSAEAFAAVATKAAELLTEHPLLTFMQDTASLLSSHDLKPLGWSLSSTGGVGALLYPIEFEGRNQSYRAARMINSLHANHLNVYASVTPKHS